MKRLLTASALSLSFLATGAGAQSAANCASRDVVVERLASGFGETRQSLGLGSNNVVIEVFASNQTGTWTITVTMPNGVTCLVASGNAFEALAESPPSQGSDA